MKTHSLLEQDPNRRLEIIAWALFLPMLGGLGLMPNQVWNPGER